MAVTSRPRIASVIATVGARRSCGVDALPVVLRIDAATAAAEKEIATARPHARAIGIFRLGEALRYAQHRHISFDPRPAITRRQRWCPRLQVNPIILDLAEESGTFRAVVRMIEVILISDLQ